VLESANRGDQENAQISIFKLYKLYIMREKAIYTQLNMFRSHPGGFLFDGFVWCPASYSLDKKLEAAFSTGSMKGLKFEKIEKEIDGLKKPTLYPQNSFMEPF
jgi:hypothetical protein